MDLRLLESFSAVVDAQSVTRAAEVLGVTQPAVSAQIARLETEVGFALFERVGGRLRFSADGRRFYAEVRNVLGLIARLEQVAGSIREGKPETLTIASHPSASISVLPAVVSEVYSNRSDARINMVNRTSEEVRGLFEAGGVDIGIAEWPIHIPAVELRRYDIDCVAVVPAGHALTRELVITPRMLVQERLIAMPATRLIGHKIKCAFGDGGAEFAPAIESEYFSAICAMVASGCGVAVVDGWSAETFRSSGVEVRPFAPAVGYEIGVFFRTTPGPTSLAAELLLILDQRLRDKMRPSGAVVAAQTRGLAVP
jgi:DNA-binding transcriptional LysR family regulator